MNKRRARAAEAEESGNTHQSSSASKKADKESSHTRVVKSNAAINAPFCIKNPSSSTPTLVATSEELTAVENESTAVQLALQRLHSPTEWLKCYQGTTKSSLRKCLRAYIQMQTINSCLRGRYFLPSGAAVNLDKKKLLQAAMNTKRYDSDYRFNYNAEAQHETQILVVRGDCLDVALWMQKEKRMNPVVLNMASGSIPGGGYRKGSAAQEENLHRRSNLFQCLEDPYQDLATTRDWSYPLPEFGGLYTPGALVFRGSEESGYEYLPYARKVSFISAASYRDPPLEETPSSQLVIASAKLIKGFKRKMTAIFDIALDNGHDSIVLSAWGCGAYGCPPNHIAQLFKEVMQSYDKKFKMISFAIYDDQNARKAHNPDGNVKPFGDVFKMDPIDVVNLEVSEKEPKQSEGTEEQRQT